jgi:hypothetical protein
MVNIPPTTAKTGLTTSMGTASFVTATELIARSRKVIAFDLSFLKSSRRLGRDVKTRD